MSRTQLIDRAVIYGGLATLLLLLAFGIWQTALPGGADHRARRAVSELEAAHAAGRYAEVVRIYETPVRAPFYRDIRMSQPIGRIGEPPKSARVMAADAYARLGDADRATAVYLDVLEWDESEYHSLCALSDGCQNLVALRLAASRVAR